MGKYRFFVISIVFVLSVNSLAAQCGPGCPVCSGTGHSTGALLPSRTLVSSAIAIPTGEDERGTYSEDIFGVKKYIELSEEAKNAELLLDIDEDDIPF